ncbi:uncharacterized protein LOC141673281 [Apium graveolens]|uniref:uncharacterized protein LOC141673281 n=1 Tax=Apium graveolens TaxID=4045 RepID=UPI003D7953EE
MATDKGKEGIVTLNYPMLTKCNYTAWAMKMRVYMQVYGVWEAIEPKDPKASVEDRQDKMALTTIYQAIPEETLLSLAEKKTAKEAWEGIKILYQGAERVRTAKIQTLKTEFEALNMKENESLDDFCMKMNSLITNIRALGEEIVESYVVKKLLRAVPSKFLQIVSTIEQFGDLEKMTIEETMGSLKIHEERLCGQSESNIGQLLLTEEEWLRKDKEKGKLLLTREEWMRRSNRGNTDSSQRFRSDNRARDNGGRGGRDRTRVRCFNCSGYGHYATECRKPRRDKELKEEVNFTKIQDDEPALLLLEKEEQAMLLNEEKIVPKLNKNKAENYTESNV